MSTRTTGGPAFPQAQPIQNEFHPSYGKDHGMTLRDYFAAAAMQGLCAGFSAQDKSWPRDDEPEGYDVAAEHAYSLADAMLAAREAA